MEPSIPEFGPYLASCRATYLAQVDASDVVKEVYVLGEERGLLSTKQAARPEPCGTKKAPQRLPAARMKERWLEDNKKRHASAPSDEPTPKHNAAAAALASAPAASAAAGVSVLNL